ncbi:hypothetical protein FF2_019889 [Malus domestica]
MEEPKPAEPTATEILTTPPSSIEILPPQPPPSFLPSRMKKRPFENDVHFSNSSTLYRDQLLRRHLMSRLVQIGVFTVLGDFNLTTSPPSSSSPTSAVATNSMPVGGSNDYGTNRILHHTIGLPDFSEELRCF